MRLFLHINQNQFPDDRNLRLQVFVFETDILKQKNPNIAAEVLKRGVGRFTPRQFHLTAPYSNLLKLLSGLHFVGKSC
jgi:hypothetical protein